MPSARSPASSPGRSRTGAFVGAITGALQIILERADETTSPAALHEAIRSATDVALAPWRQHLKIGK